MNAILHSDYSKTGSVFIQWQSDHLLITNPGWFPEGVAPDNLLIHESKPRNPRLAEIFQEVNREGVGKGTSYVWMGS